MSSKSGLGEIPDAQDRRGLWGEKTRAAIRPALKNMGRCNVLATATTPTHICEWLDPLRHGRSRLAH
jgi:hypothetical protein